MVVSFKFDFNCSTGERNIITYLVEHKKHNQILIAPNVHVLVDFAMSFVAKIPSVIMCGNIVYQNVMEQLGHGLVYFCWHIVNATPSIY